jgi:anti-sigma regulatory factor (Ser/Thr protein kinase)
MLLERLSAAGGSLADQGADVLELALPARASSAGDARRALAGYCRSLCVPAGLTEVGVLVTSELVTNAVLHARTPFLMWAEYDAPAAQLGLAVVDGEASLPTLVPMDTELDGGRGIAMIDLLGATWGLVRTSMGKIVWVTINDPDRPPASPSRRLHSDPVG